MKKIYYLLIILVALLIYYPVFNADYVWDDNLLFVDKVRLVNEPLSWALLTEPVLPGTTYFRPLIFFTIYLEFYLFGQHPFSSHIINLLILIANSYLVSLIAYQLLEIKKSKSAMLLSLIAGLVYVVNPVLVEATAWISGRFDLLVTTFSLLAIYVFIKIKVNTWKNSLLISVLFLLALFSKELGIIIPGLIFCMYMYLNVSHEKSYISNIKVFIKNYYRLIICIFFTTVFYFLLRIQAMGSMYHQQLDYEYFKTIYFQDFLPIHSLFFYIKQFIVPFSQLTPLLPYDHLNERMYLVFIKGITILAVIAAILWGLIKKNRYVWLVLSTLLTISLVIYLIPLTISNNFAHNRFMTLGAAFVALLVVVLPYEKLKPYMQKLLMGCLAVWLCLAILITKSVVPFWQTDFSLWKWTYTVQPDNKLAFHSYIFGLYESRQFSEVNKVIENYRQTGELTPSDQMIYINTLISLNDPEALKYAQGVYEILPKLHELYNSKSDYEFSALSNPQIASFYGAYALATAIFENNPEKALKISDIAYWYLNDDEKTTYAFNDVLYLYQSGKKEEAINLYNYLKKIEAYSKDRYYYNMVNVFYISCLNKKSNNEQICKEERASFLKALGE